MQTMRRTALAVFVILVLCLPAAGADWPQWRGPNRDATSAEQHLLQQWPAGGPRQEWTIEGIGQGFSAPTIAAGRIFVTGMLGTDGYLFAFNRAGRLLWATAYGKEWASAWGGPRTTPAVDGDAVFLISAYGVAACLDVRDGHIRWSIDLRREYGARTVNHGICENPLVVGQYLICTPGGPTVSVVALNKQTGALGWKVETKEQPAYCSPQLIRRGGREIVAVILGGSLFGIDAATGQRLWSYTYDPTGGNWPCAIPTYYEGTVYGPLGKGACAKTFIVSADGTAITPRWEQEKMTCHHGGVVVAEGCIFGTPNVSPLTCLDAATGQVLWQGPKERQMATVAYADGRLYVLFADGEVRLVRPSREKYEALGAFRLPAGEAESWAHLAIADGRLYARRGSALMAFDISMLCGARAATPSYTRVAMPKWEAGLSRVRLAAQRFVVAPVVATAPRIDGTLGDACWRTLPPVVLSVPADAGPDSQPLVQFKLCRDAQHLFVAYQRGAALRDGQPVALQGRHTTADAQCWTDDECELFISDAAARVAVQVGLSCGGGWFVGRRGIESLEPTDFKWPGRDGWQRAVHKADAEWSAEVAIPFAFLQQAGLDPTSLAVNLMSQNRSGVGAWRRLLTAPGSRGFEHCTEFFPLKEAVASAASRRATLCIHFTPPVGGPVQPRLLALTAQGQSLGADFDLATQAPNAAGALCQEFSNITIGPDGLLTVRVTPASAATTMCFLEVHTAPCTD
jgi:outer membrane protein assembly factor BamB